MTELYLLQDASADRADTWAFLQRRAAELNGVQSLLNGVGGAAAISAGDSTAANAMTVVRSVAETVRNMTTAFGR